MILQATLQVSLDINLVMEPKKLSPLIYTMSLILKLGPHVYINTHTHTHMKTNTQY